MYVSYRYLCTWYVVNLILLALSIWDLSRETFLNGQSCLAHKFPSVLISDLRKGRMTKRYSTLLGLIVLFEAVTKLLGLAWFDRTSMRRWSSRSTLTIRLSSSLPILEPRCDCKSQSDVTRCSEPTRDGRSSRFTLTNRPLKSGSHRDSTAWLSRRKCPN